MRRAATRTRRPLARFGRAKAATGTRRRAAGVAAASVAGMALAGAVARKRTGASDSPAPGAPVRATTTVLRPPEEVYAAWRDLESLPLFLDHLQRVETGGEKRSHWVARGPAGRTIEWDAEIVEDVPGQTLAWRSLEGADVVNTGSVRFAPAPSDQGTEVTVEVDYSLPGGAVGSAVSRLFGEEPGQQIRDDLRRFKQVLETGEVVRSDGTPGGIQAAGQLRQHVAQPAG